MGWSTTGPRARADVIVIGTGQAGMPLATRLAAAGKHVLIAERAEPGGTCSNSGCTPTKTMIASARAAHVARTAGRLGVSIGDGHVRVDLSAVVARKDALVKRWRDGVDRRLRKAGDRLTFVRGHARFVAEHEIEISGERHHADTIVINVGARPVVPAIRGLEGVPWLDNRRAMELVQLPEHLVVLGGGYVGCELGQMFRRFGSRVTIVDRSAHLLSDQDDDISAELERLFRAEGITLEAGATVREVSKVGGVTVTLEDGRIISGTNLLVATGRRPNTDDLGCEQAGIELDSGGYLVVDERYQTNVQGVFAVGDAIRQPQFTHVSWDDHRRLFDVLVGRPGRGRSARHVPFTVFTDPQVAGVGITERQARESGVPHEVATMPFGHVARAIEVDELAGLLKVIVDPGTERILGASIVGAEAGELIAVFVALMQADAPARALVEAEIVHPTFAEGLQSVLMKLPRFALS